MQAIYKFFGSLSPYISERLFAERANPIISIYRSLIGPFKITQMKSKDNRITVYLFYDVHLKGYFDESNCVRPKIRIDRFIKQTVRANPSKVLDLFIEYQYTKECPDCLTAEGFAHFQKAFDSGYVSSILKTLKRRPLPNLRIHNADIRSFGELFIYFQFRVFPEAYVRRELPQIIKNSKELGLIAKGTNNQIDIMRLLSLSKIGKQIRYIENKKISNYLRTIIYQYADDPSNQIYLSNKNMQQMFEKFSNLGNKIVDWYTLSRMFRSYPSNPDGQAKNIMLYFGGVHMDNIKKILLDLEFKIVHEIGAQTYSKEMDQCNDISGFVQPFFQ